VFIDLLQYDTLVVKDFDGSLKVLAGGELKDLDSVLKQSEVTSEQSAPSSAVEMDLAMPKFTDLAEVSDDPMFVQPAAEGSKKDKSELHFHSDDQAEIKQELEKLSPLN